MFALSHISYFLGQDDTGPFKVSVEPSNVHSVIELVSTFLFTLQQMQFKLANTVELGDCQCEVVQYSSKLHPHTMYFDECRDIFGAVEMPKNVVVDLRLRQYVACRVLAAQTPSKVSCFASARSVCCAGR